MSFTVSHKPIPASHLWLCDDNGDVYALRDLKDCIGALAMSEMDPNLVQHEPNWVKVDSGFDQIQAGHGGLVCGLKRSNVYVRTGVTHDRPIGLNWNVAYCSASEISVGKNCVVRKSKDGIFYMTNITDSLCEAVFLPNWTSIPQCDMELTNGYHTGEVKMFQHVVLDSNDRLFALTPLGEVFGYYSLLDIVSPSWKMVCRPPPAVTNRSGLGQRLVSWWKGSQEAHFSHVSVGKRCVWCVRENGEREVWQLVLSELEMKNGKLELKPNWEKVHLPIKNSIVHLCEDKCTPDELIVVCKNEIEETRIVFLSLNPEKKVSIGLPKSCNGVSIKSIAVSRTQTDVFRATPPPPKKQKVSSLYPSIRALDICCLNGDCYRCQKASQEGSLVRIPSVLMPSQEMESNTEQYAAIPLVSRAENSSVGEVTLYSELRKRKRKNPFSHTSESEELFGISSSKRSKMEHSNDEMRFLLNSVTVACMGPSVLQDKHFEEPQDIELPTKLTAEQVDKQFVYSFEVEHIVLYETNTPVEQSYRPLGE